jgi:hemerythrin-like domain-containing protein
MQTERRKFFLGAAGAGLVLASCSHPAKPADVTPPEDLMREHGALDRILLLYDDCTRRIAAHEAFDADVIASAADIVRRFVEDYHEKLEENFLFPRFEAKGTLVDLVATLRKQHAAGRTLTEKILKLAKATNANVDLDAALRAFVRMYRPHAAREDTALFPALRDVISPKEFDELGDKFEDEEHRLFGKEGFDGIVVQIGELERRVGLYDLNQFTPPSS